MDIRAAALVPLNERWAMVGSFGLASRRAHMVMGRTVTIASRLAEMTADLAHPILLGEGMAAQLQKGSWPQTELFAWLQSTAAISDFEMNRTFNNGIGMVVVIDAANAAACAATLREAGETVYEIGVIAPIGDGAAVTVS